MWATLRLGRPVHEILDEMRKTAGRVVFTGLHAGVECLKTCDIMEEVAEPLARRAALLRRLARRGSAVDALVVALARSVIIFCKQLPHRLQH